MEAQGGEEEDLKVEHVEDSQLEPPLLGLHLPPASPESQIQDPPQRPASEMEDVQEPSHLKGSQHEPGSRSAHPAQKHSLQTEVVDVEESQPMTPTEMEETPGKVSVKEPVQEIKGETEEPKSAILPEIKQEPKERKKKNKIVCAEAKTEAQPKRDLEPPKSEAPKRLRAEAAEKGKAEIAQSGFDSASEGEQGTGTTAAASKQAFKDRRPLVQNEKYVDEEAEKRANMLMRELYKTQGIKFSDEDVVLAQKKMRQIIREGEDEADEDEEKRLAEAAEDSDDEKRGRGRGRGRGRPRGLGRGRGRKSQDDEEAGPSEKEAEEKTGASKAEETEAMGGEQGQKEKKVKRKRQEGDENREKPPSKSPKETKDALKDEPTDTVPVAKGEVKKDALKEEPVDTVPVAKGEVKKEASKEEPLDTVPVAKSSPFKLAARASKRAMEKSKDPVSKNLEAEFKDAGEGKKKSSKMTVEQCMAPCTHKPTTLCGFVFVHSHYHFETRALRNVA